MNDELETERGSTIADAPLVEWLFNSPRAGLIWLVPRLWLGYRWIDAAIHKVTNPAWVDGGEALKGFWMNAIPFPRLEGHQSHSIGTGHLSKPC
ncbi:MAG: hypothetical protein V3U32_00410 [Anaerolineales bacterium]